MTSRKRSASVTAGILAAAILLTGTFAWQSISQQAKNEIVRTVNPGGRLHDDFDGESKDVYVENFMKKGEGGQPIFARVRLDEYMEIGKNAGSRDPEKRTDLNILAMSSKNDGNKADIDDVTTWRTHIPNDDTDPFHPFWEWTTGGETVFMPTFNKNKDSLSADINGTWEGKTPGDYDHFDDYVEYTEGKTVKAMAYYDMDDNAIDEYDPKNPAGHVPGAGGNKDEHYRESEETHTAKKTLNATVMTMADWITAGRPMGPIWVYDTDGWAYWAQAIQPGEATGLLLDGIEYIKDDENPCYYGINVVAQFATKDDWGKPASGDQPATGFYDLTKGKAPTDNALFLLKQAAGLEYGVSVAAEGVADGTAIEVAPGGSLTFKATVKVGKTETAEGTAAPSQTVTWSVSGAKSKDTKIDDKGKLTVGADEREDTVLTVQAKTWNRVVGTATVTVKAAAAPVTPGSGEGGGSGSGGGEGGTGGAGGATDPSGGEESGGGTDVGGDTPAVDEPSAGEPVVDEPVTDPAEEEPTSGEPVSEPVEGEPAVDGPAAVDDPAGLGESEPNAGQDEPAAPDAGPADAPESGLAPEPAAE